MANIFLDFKGKKKVEGETTSKGFEKQLEIDSFTFGVSNPRAASVSGVGGQSEGTASLSSVTISRAVDKASPTVFQGCCAGDVWDEVFIRARRTTSGGSTAMTYMTVSLKNAMIESYSVSGAAESRPMETFGIAFDFVKWEHAVEDASGGKAGHVEASWNLATQDLK